MELSKLGPENIRFVIKAAEEICFGISQYVVGISLIEKKARDCKCSETACCIDQTLGRDTFWPYLAFRLHLHATIPPKDISI